MIHNSDQAQLAESAAVVFDSTRGYLTHTWTWCYTNVTQMSHKCHTNVTQMSHKCHTIVTQMSHKCHTNVTQMSHKCHTNVTNVTQMSHKCHTNVTQMSHKCHTNVTQMSHKCHTNVTQMSYKCHTIVTPNTGVRQPGWVEKVREQTQQRKDAREARKPPGRAHTSQRAPLVFVQSCPPPNGYVTATNPLILSLFGPGHVTNRNPGTANLPNM
jgi:hypothetical protein